MKYLYGLIEMQGLPSSQTIDPLPMTLGPISTRRIDDWTLVYGDYDGEEILPKRRLMLAHTKVLETLMGQGTLLPARFGLLADSDAAVDQLIGQRKAQILAAFDRVRGCVELGIRICFDRDVALLAALSDSPDLIRRRDALARRGAEAHFERAEFGRSLAEHLDRRRGTAQKRLLDALRPHHQAHVLRAPEDDVEVLRAEFLVKQDEQAQFINAVEAATAQCTFAPGDEPRIQVIGPVPMYNFVRLSLNVKKTEEAT